MADRLTPAQVLALVPQQPPFRFVDEILSVDERRIEGAVTFREDMDFYRGHFPGKPVTPGVILLEAMCQIVVVAHGLFLLSLEEPAEELRRWTTFFSDAEVEFLKPVLPGDRVIVRAEPLPWRRKRLRSKIEMSRPDGTPVARATAAGMGVRNDV